MRFPDAVSHLDWQIGSSSRLQVFFTTEFTECWHHSHAVRDYPKIFSQVKLKDGRLVVKSFGGSVPWKNMPRKNHAALGTYIVIWLTKNRQPKNSMKAESMWRTELLRRATRYKPPKQPFFSVCRGLERRCACNARALLSRRWGGKGRWLRWIFFSQKYLQTCKDPAEFS